MLPFEMKLADIARGVSGARLEGNGDVDITGIAYDSRRVKPGDLFVAVGGIRDDGHVFAADAVKKGAVAAALEHAVPLPAGTAVMLVPSTRIGLAEIAAEYYGRPARLLEVGPGVIEGQVLGLSTRLAEGLARHGCEIVEPWPRSRDESSGIVSFRKPGITAVVVLRDLSAAHVIARTHQDFVRLSPHFYNTEEEVDRVLDVMSPERVSP